MPVITDLIDNIMSIPSCLQDSNSKVTLVREWIKQNPKPDKIDLPEPARDLETSEKLKWNDTPGVARSGRKSIDEVVSTSRGPRSRCNSGELPDIAGISLSQPVTPKRYYVYFVSLGYIMLFLTCVLEMLNEIQSLCCQKSNT